MHNDTFYSSPIGGTFLRANIEYRPTILVDTIVIS